MGILMIEKFAKSKPTSFYVLIEPRPSKSAPKTLHLITLCDMGFGFTNMDGKPNQLQQ